MGKNASKTLYIFRDGALLLTIRDRIKPMLDRDSIEVLRTVLNGESVEIDETVKRLVDIKLLKTTENGVEINDHRKAITKLIVGE